MKKIILLILTIITSLTLILDTHAYVAPDAVDYVVLTSYGSFVQPGTTSEYEEHELNYYFTSLLGYNTNNLIDLYDYSQLNEVDIVIMISPLNEIVRNVLLADGIYVNIPLSKFSYVVISYTTEYIYVYKQTNELIISLDIVNYSELSIEFTIQVYDYQGQNEAYNRGYDRGYANGQSDGYDIGRNEYGYFNGSNWITANVYGSERYIAGLNENREHFGILYNDVWLTAEQWGEARFDAGYDKGLSNEIDWWSWSTTFFLMPFRILNIEILPGVRIGYFALFSLLLGVVGWFFFIVGKGGGRKK